MCPGCQQTQRLNIFCLGERCCCCADLPCPFLGSGGIGQDKIEQRGVGNLHLCGIILLLSDKGSDQLLSGSGIERLPVSASLWIGDARPTIEADQDDVEWTLSLAYLRV